MLIEVLNQSGKPWEINEGDIILPSLVVLCKGNKDGDVIFLCLEILSDAMVIYLNELLGVEQSLEDLKTISSTLFLPPHKLLSMLTWHA